MNPILEKMRDKNLKKKVYQRIVTNNMTIVAHRLFKGDRTLHLAFIIYRLRRDFGFTDFEVANFTGIPVGVINKMRQKLRPILESKVLQTLSKMDYDEDLNEWMMKNDGHGAPQGYYIVKERKPWYHDERYEEKYKEPLIKLGLESEKEYEEKRSKNKSRVTDSS